jgi:peptide/nickel transport system substrate-binding protein
VNVAYEQLDDVSKVPNVKIVLKGVEINESNTWLGFNLTRKISGNPKVREAIAYAIDKDAVAKKAFYGYCTIGQTIIPTNSWCYNPDAPQYTRNVAKANNILDEAGYPRGSDGSRFQLDIMFQSGLGYTDKAADVILDNLRDVGINIKEAGGERAYYLQKQQDKTFDLFLGTMGNGPDYTVGIARIFLSTQIKPVPFTNLAQYTNPKVDELWSTISATSVNDRPKLKTLYFELQNILNQPDQLPYINLNTMGNIACFKDKFVGLHTWSADSTIEGFDTIWEKTT